MNEDQFKEGLRNLEIPPSKQVWSGLSQRLDKRRAVSKMRIYRWLAVACSLALIAVSGLYFSHMYHDHHHDVFVATADYSFQNITELDLAQHHDYISPSTITELNSAYATYSNKHSYQ